MTHLDDADIIPLWASLAVGAVGFAAFLFMLLWLSRRRGAFMKQARASAAMFAALAVVILDVSLMNRQGSTVRDDGVDAVWSRWVMYAIVWILFSWSTSNVLTNNHTFVAFTAIAASGLGAASMVMTSISSGNNVWLWYAVAGGLWLFGFLAYIISYWWYGKGTRQVSMRSVIFLLGMLGLIYGAFYLFFGLGHAVGDVFSSINAERWAYFGAEVLLWLLWVIVILIDNNIIPQRFLGQRVAGHTRPKVAADWR